MAKVAHRKARTDIYQYGLKTENKDNKSGHSIDRSKPANDKDTILVKKGEMYYTWSLFGDRKSRISLTPPKRQQLTNSGFKCSVYDIEDRISDLCASTVEDLRSEVEEIVQEIHDLASEQEDKRSNMPDHLQDVGSGEILQNRYDELENWAQELEGIDIEDMDEEEGQTEEEKEGALEEHFNNIIADLQGCSYNGE